MRALRPVRKADRPGAARRSHSMSHKQVSTFEVFFWAAVGFLTGVAVVAVVAWRS